MIKVSNLISLSDCICVDIPNSHPPAPSYTSNCLGMDNTMTTRQHLCKLHSDVFMHQPVFPGNGRQRQIR